MTHNEQTASPEAVMDDQRMVTKANQIAAFFAPYPHDKAIEGVTDHLQKFWTKAMHRQLKAYIEQEQGKGLNDLVIEASQQL